MSFNFNGFNKRNTIMDGITTENKTFRPLKDFIGEEVKVKGFFFTEGRFGRQVVVVTDDCLINMPARAVDDFVGFKDDREALDTILAGGLKLVNIKMSESKTYGAFVAFDYANC